MKSSLCVFTVLIVILFYLPLSIAAQGDEEHQNGGDYPVHKSKFLTGLYVGSYFANKYTASMYNGYGFDIDGNRNSFTNSFMYQKIKNEFGGGYGQQDMIAQAIGVDPQQWEFNESDMPSEMRYTPAIMVGANFKIPAGKKSSFLLNFNASKISAEGLFTISTIRPVNPDPTKTSNILTFPIRGSEQRLLFQLGFQHLFGDDEKLNFFLEGGLMGTLSKFNSNTIYINTLTIDLMQFVNQTMFPAPNPTIRPLGFGVGAFAGFGVNIDMSSKFNVQLVYQPTYEKINMGVRPTLKWQHGIGLRFYYKL